MGAKKSKQSLARRDVPSGGMYGGAGDQADYAERSSDQPATAATETAAAVETEDTARESVQEQAGRVDTEATVIGRYVAPACTACASVNPNRRTTYVTSTKATINSATERITPRCIRCSNCGNTWTDYEVIKHKVQSRVPNSTM